MSDAKKQTHQLCHMKEIESNGWLDVIPTEELKPSQDPEEGTYSIENGRVLETEAEVHMIMATATEVFGEVRRAAVVLPSLERRGVMKP